MVSRAKLIGDDILALDLVSCLLAEKSETTCCLASAGFRIVIMGPPRPRLFEFDRAMGMVVVAFWRGV
jgi:hypothetical protein